MARAIPVPNDKLHDVLTLLKKENFDHIHHNDQLFLERIYCNGLQKYIDRLNAIDFSGNQRVLDAGCGYGQWSIALSQLNDYVDCCDTADLRVRFLDSLASHLSIDNIQAFVSSIDKLPYPDSHFDAIFCYGVIFLSPWRESLLEFTRILKPGGKLYINANAVGWYLFLWNEEHNKADDYDPKAIAASTFTDTLRYEREKIFQPGMNLIIDPNSLKSAMHHLGFMDIELAAEGHLRLNKAYAEPNPFFKGEYYGQLGAYEIIGTKYPLNKNNTFLI